MKHPPNIIIGIMDHQSEVNGQLHGDFRGDGFGPVSGAFSAKADSGMIVLFDEGHHEIVRLLSIRLKGESKSTFSLFDILIGNHFHWERKEKQTFQGDLTLLPRDDKTILVINEIPLEDYLKSVVSSEMSGAAPIEFLKAHAIISRSWLLGALDRKEKNRETSGSSEKIANQEVIRWYDREEHDDFDVCADDHCQRYQGISKIISKQAEEAVRETQGKVITYRNKICDARYSKACGGLTDNFETAWEDRNIPYLKCISDAPVPHRAINTEEEASAWCLGSPDAYCNTKDEDLLERILPDVDRQTSAFFRWKIEYSGSELEEILEAKSGLAFGTLHEIVPLCRGPSARISRLRIVGSKRSIVVGKELEIRRWLSRTHLYSSAFTVTAEAGRFIFHGAGWGHGVGLCQIGAAVMASKGFSAEKILKHYFQGVEIKSIY